MDGKVDLLEAYLYQHDAPRECLLQVGVWAVMAPPCGVAREGRHLVPRVVTVMMVASVTTGSWAATETDNCAVAPVSKSSVSNI